MRKQHCTTMSIPHAYLASKKPCTSTVSLPAPRCAAADRFMAGIEVICALKKKVKRKNPATGGEHAHMTHEHQAPGVALGVRQAWHRHGTRANEGKKVSRACLQANQLVV